MAHPVARSRASHPIGGRDRKTVEATGRIEIGIGLVDVDQQKWFVTIRPIHDRQIGCDRETVFGHRDRQAIRKSNASAQHPIVHLQRGHQDLIDPCRVQSR